MFHASSHNVISQLTTSGHQVWSKSKQRLLWGHMQSLRKKLNNSLWRLFDGRSVGHLVGETCEATNCMLSSSMLGLPWGPLSPNVAQCCLMSLNITATLGHYLPKNPNDAHYRLTSQRQCTTTCPRNPNVAHYRLTSQRQCATTCPRNPNV